MPDSKSDAEAIITAREVSFRSPTRTARIGKARTAKTLVRRLVEESWVVGVALATLLAAGCEKKKEAAEASAPSTSAKAEGGAVVFPAGSPQLAWAAPRKDVDSAESDLARAQSEQERGLARLALYGGSMG
ncbi:MAG: hypothetical protein EB034_25090, partial [Verrucomicrobia bacterium]|nr:hypothetical protein [Verrucomicrobiota bacterium]